MKNNKIKFLLENGVSKTTISKMTESQINALTERFKKSKKEESKEAVTQKVTTTYEIPNADLEKGTTIPEVPGKKMVIQKTATGIKATPTEGEVSEDATIDDTINQDEFGGNKPVNYKNPEDYGTDNSVDPDGSLDGMPTEGVIKEKFESKAQQGLFWARCNKCSDKKCKWCKMAKEFSDSTSKKQYKDMPEKKTP